MCLKTLLSCKSINSSTWLHLKQGSFLCSALWFIMIPFTLGLHIHLLSRVMWPCSNTMWMEIKNYLTKYKPVPTLFVEHLASSSMIFCSSCLDPTSVSLFETGSHIAHAGFKLTMLTRITLNSESSCLYFLNDRITDVYYHTRMVVPMFSTLWTCTFQTSTILG